MAELQDNLPPGWECKLDNLTGKSYFLNHYTKTSTWEDPRNRHRPFHGAPKQLPSVAVEHIPLQHGSPELRRNYVYPSQTSPIPAFQMPAHHSPKYNNPLQDIRSFPRMSPLTVRAAKTQDSSFIVQSESDEAVGKISAMFPTVSETHIRLLMKKYHSREALVISALQVEKNPITTPGPFATPPPQRNIHHPGVYALHMTPPLGLRASSRGGSPILRPGSGATNSTGSPRIGDAFRSSPRPHSSPKLKLRYMKSIFPQAEETVILEVLYNNESNIQKTSEVLKDMGFQRKDTVKCAQQKMEAKAEADRVEEAKRMEPPVVVVVKVKTAEEKANIKAQLREKYKDVAEQLITIALESVDYNENRAGQILDIMVEEDTEKKLAVITLVEEEPSVSVVDSLEAALPVSQSRQSIKSLLKSDKIDKEKNTFCRVIEEFKMGYKSNNISSTKGPNPELLKGANDKILLDDYVNWQGANPVLNQGPQCLSKGPNRSLLGNRSYQSCGSNPELRKGPNYGLAKGSIFSQLKGVIGESRGN